MENNSSGQQVEMEYIRKAVERIELAVERIEQQNGQFREVYERRHAELAARTEAAHARIEAIKTHDLQRWMRVDDMEIDLRVLVRRVDSMRMLGLGLLVICGVTAVGMLMLLMAQM